MTTSDSKQLPSGQSNLT